MNYQDALDAESKIALEERILFLKETKPEIFDASGKYDTFGFFDSVHQNSLLDEDVFPKNVQSPPEDAIKTVKLSMEWNKLLNEDKILFVKDELKKHVKDLVRQGIPQEYRGDAWQVLLNSRALYNQNELNSESRYCKFLGSPINEKTQTQILKDIDRTQPCMRFFRSENRLRQLFRLLKAYAAYNPRVDYCQGMNFPASVLLYQMPEPQAYWAFVQLMKQAGVMYKDGLEGMRDKCETFGRLLQRTEPRIAQHLNQFEIRPDQYGPGWFMSIFLNAFEFPQAMRVFEQYLFEGDKVLHRAGIAILKYASSLPTLRVRGEINSIQYEQAFEQARKGTKGTSLLCMPMTTSMIFIQRISLLIKDQDAFQKLMLSVNFKTRDMKAIEEEIRRARLAKAK